MMASAEHDSRAALAPAIEGRRLLVVIPALDEAKTVASVILGIPRKLDGVSSVEVLVVDDGSSDDTAAEAQRARVEEGMKTGLRISLGLNL